MNNKKKTKNRKLKKQDSWISLVRVELASNNRTIRQKGLYKLKNQTPPIELFHAFQQAIPNRETLTGIHGEPFPSALDSVFSTPLLTPASSVANEIIWGIERCLHFSKEISDFCELRASFEKCMVSDSKDEAISILKQIENTLGWSLWLTQNRLASTLVWEGLDAKRKMQVEFETASELSPLLSVLIRFIGKRIEGTSVPGYLQSELAQQYQNRINKNVYEYLKTKLFNLDNPAVDAMSITLALEGQASLIDHYEILVAILIGIASDKEYCGHLSSIMLKPITMLFAKTKDRRLYPVLVAMGGEIDYEISTNARRIQFFEAYSEGRYSDAISIGIGQLEYAPTDMAVLVLCIKAELKIDSQSHLTGKGILAEVIDYLRHVLSFDEQTYASALSIYTIYDRFYGHTWANYVRAMVIHELSQELNSYTTITARKLLSLDINLTPFSAILEPEYFPQKLITQFYKKSLFASTIHAFEIAVNGPSAARATLLNEERFRRYSAIYQLTHGQYDEAIENFRWCKNQSTGAVALRCAIGESLAHLHKQDLLAASESIIKAYFKYPHVPTVLPLIEMTRALSQPDRWPNSIAIPIIFELYTNYFHLDYLTHLRLSFERFQLDNSITSPILLCEKVTEWGKENIVFYLKRVWRPEVMRQTILYEGTKDIEEARIQVCKSLVELDPENAQEYLAEIRERVKNQELAKATKLVEQSKVYVDIGAIKKALRNKLGDAYSRYKTAMANMPTLENTLVTNLTKVISELNSPESSMSQILSSIHIVSSNYVNSELDSQFAAMFKEVTNEFLLGEHGLNAYLSTRVRHGKLSNTLRKPVADEHLITERKEGTNNYTQNTYWRENLSHLSEDERARALRTLDDFSSKIDEIISHIRDELIQINISHELVNSSSNSSSNALFIYQTSNLERMFVQTSDQQIKHIDGFITLCVESLWDKTDTNLIKVRNVIDTKVRTKFLEAFDHLSESIMQLGIGDGLGELQNHIVRARTNIQTRLSMVSSWFKRSEVYDRQDYELEFPVLIAKAMIENSISGAQNWQGIILNPISSNRMMPGSTLDGMVDIFCGLIENAISHAGLEIDKLTVNVELNLTDGKFNATVTNIVETSAFESRDESNLDRIRLEIQKSDTRHKAQLEGKSGFHKMWATLNSPQYREPYLEFRYDLQSRFEVKFGFGIETEYHENIAC